MLLPLVIILTITSILVTLVNVCCIVVIFKKPVKKPSDMTICSLIIGHAIQGTLVIPCYAAKRSRVLNQTIVCDVFRFSYLFTNYVCCLSVLIISVDRVIGVSFPLRYQIWITNKRMTRLLICFWVYVLLLCMVPFIPSNIKECNYNPQDSWVITMLTGHILLPFLIIILCYILICKKVRSVLYLREYLTNSKSILARDIQQQQKKFRTILIVIGTYLLCWGPDFTYYILSILCPKKCFTKDFFHKSDERITGFVIKMLTFIDGVIAPVVYCWVNESFNVSLMKILSRVAFRFTNGSAPVKKKVLYINSDNRRIHSADEELLSDNICSIIWEDLKETNV